jgi:hypothetical protein
MIPSSCNRNMKFNVSKTKLEKEFTISPKDLF